MDFFYFFFWGGGWMGVGGGKMYPNMSVSSGNRNWNLWPLLIVISTFIIILIKKETCDRESGIIKMRLIKDPRLLAWALPWLPSLLQLSSEWRLRISILCSGIGSEEEGKKSSHEHIWFFTYWIYCTEVMKIKCFHGKTAQRKGERTKQGRVGFTLSTLSESWLHSLHTKWELTPLSPY